MTPVHRIRLALLLLTVLAMLSLGSNHVQAQTTDEASRPPIVKTVYFPRTGHHLSNRVGFLDFWRSHGQEIIFGDPLTEEVVEDGRIVQYFERARFEYHPDSDSSAGVVRLGTLGREASAGLDASLTAPVADPQNGARYFPETGHTLSGEFLTYWEKRGALDLFGYPISEEFEQDGYTVQYFERVRLSYHPEDISAFYRSFEGYNNINLNTLHEVQISDLGSAIAAQHGMGVAAVDRLPGAIDWTPKLWSQRISVDLTKQWLSAYEGEMLVYRAPVATGRDGFDTPPGHYQIYYKLPVQTMTGSMGGEHWVVQNVPWVQYVVGSVALHGTYWHTRFGSGYRLSHGCVNLGMDDAEWLYDWADIGTEVEIHF